MSKAPNLPKAPKIYSDQYLNQLLRMLEQYFLTLDNPGPLQATMLNLSYFNGSEIVAGLIPTDTLNGAVLAAATTLTLDSTDSFASAGNAYILDGSSSDKLSYTSKTLTTLNGVTGIDHAHADGLLIVASGRTGDIFADPLQEYTLKMIP